MADDDLRRLRRRWEETGTPEDEALWLQARLRAGELRQAHLQLAARLGHPAARLASASSPRPLRLIELVTHEEAEIRLRTWLALGWSLLTVHADARYDVQLADLESAFVRGGELTSRSFTLEATAASDALEAGLTQAREALYDLRPELRPPQLHEFLRGHPAVDEALIEQLTYEYRPGRSDRVLALVNLQDLGGSLPPLLPTARDELLPWLLGTSDPVALRVEARR